VKRFPKLKKYPKEAQEMFLKVLNAALEQYPDDEGKAIATAWSALYRKYGKRDEIEFQSARYMAPFTEAEGIIKIPTIFTREGVMNGGYKPWEDGGEGKRGLKHSAPTFEGKPVIYRHPPEHRPANQEDQIIGWCSDVVAREEDRVIHGITNIKVEDAPPQFVENIRHGESREGSIGYWEDSEYISGVFNDVPYERIEWNICGDHYAVGIPRGACSVEMGCGLGFDEERGESELAETIHLDEMEGEGIMCWDKLKEFLLDTFRRNYKKAPEDTAWDLRRADYTLAQLKRASAVVTGDGTKKSDCRLPHHKPDGTLVWHGVDAAGKSLMGARDGVQLSSSDKAKAKRHLTRHYREFGKTPPWEKTKGDIDMSMRLNEEERTTYEEKIKELETLKTSLESEKTALETEKETILEELESLKSWKEETEPKLQSYIQAEQEAVEKQREELITKIVEVTGEENEAAKEKYKDWSVEQLAHFEATIVKPTDRSALEMPISIGKPDASVAEKTSAEIAGKELTVGSLLGKKAEEY